MTINTDSWAQPVDSPPPRHVPDPMIDDLRRFPGQWFLVLRGARHAQHVMQTRARLSNNGIRVAIRTDDEKTSLYAQAPETPDAKPVLGDDELRRGHTRFVASFTPVDEPPPKYGISEAVLVAEALRGVPGQWYKLERVRASAQKELKLLGCEAVVRQGTLYARFPKELS